jgi:hypothetical protein
MRDGDAFYQVDCVNTREPADVTAEDAPLSVKRQYWEDRLRKAVPSARQSTVEIPLRRS